MFFSQYDCQSVSYQGGKVIDDVTIVRNSGYPAWLWSLYIQNLHKNIYNIPTAAAAAAATAANMNTNYVYS